GGKPTSDQQRMDPWHIITWLTELRIRCLLVENVPEFTDWSPVDARTGRPLKSRRGEYFRRWVATIEGLGFKVDWRILNAADYGDATTRHRFFLIARSDGKPLLWPEPTHAKSDFEDRLFGTSRKPWRPAREIIDWRLRGTSIFSRKKPLSVKTLARIYAGAVKFRWPEPFLVILRQHMDAQSVDGPLPTITANGTHIALAEPFITSVSHGVFADKNSDARRCKSIKEPLQTIEASGGKFGIVEPFMLGQHFRCDRRSIDEPTPAVTTVSRIGVVEPFVIANRNHNTAKSLDEPTPPVLTGNHLALVSPYYGDRNGKPRVPQSVEEPLGTQTTENRFALVEPFVLNRHGDRSSGGVRAHDVDAPLPTATQDGAGYLVEPFVLSQATGGAPRSVDEPLPTVTGDGAEALIAPYYTSGSGKTCSSTKAPLPTLTTKDRLGLVLPITHTGRRNARSVEEPIPTVTTAHRGELAFITAGFGERDGQAARVRSVEAPAFTVCAQGHIGLVEGQGYDILFRMLQPHELAAAMGFNTDETQYEFSGTKTDVIRQIGNAIPVNLAAALVKALMENRS
ncbi:MAG TPA: DNA cytosine methyltransferase, partial [Nitrospira sp.]|nr:DNA cytosine methyltransferase [Nitrospira sp.]